MLTQSFLSKLSDLAKSSRFLFFITFLMFGLVQASDDSKKPAPMKSDQVAETNKIAARMNKKALADAKWQILSNGPVRPVGILGAQVCPPWPD